MRRIHTGVYVVGPIAAPRTGEMAAVLACGRKAALSHWSAIARMHLTTCENGKIHVLAWGSRPGAKAGVCIHLARTVHEDEITERENIPITTPVRTLYDLASYTDSRSLERALAEMLARKLAGVEDVQALVTRYAGRPGARTLQRLLDSESEPALTRSQAEERFLALIRKAQLGHPEVNRWLEGFLVDFYWRSEGLVVEIDGREYHFTERSFEADRRRDAVLLGAGIRVMRVTWQQIVKEPMAVVARVARALAAPRGGAG